MASTFLEEPSSVPLASLEASDGQLFTRFVVCGNLFELPSHYQPLKPIGKGAYGIVCSAVDTSTGERVAVKRISGAFDNTVDAKRTLREIMLLRQLRHENIIAIKDVMRPPGAQAFTDLYVVYELADTDLHQVIRSNQPLSDDHIQYFLYQILRGLKYIHSANVLHRDLKPSNLLLNANCDLKICDFGLARTGTEREFMTEYVVTRWYRAPELLLSCTEYTAAIDTWSVGCIFAEMLGRRPLFPGKDYVHQLSLITRLIGTPSEHDLGWIQSDKARRYLTSLPPCPRSDFSRLYPGASSAAVALVDAMLAFSPQRRCTVDEAMAHPYLASLHDPADEPVAPLPFEFSFDTDQLDENGVRALVERECASYSALRKAQALAGDTQHLGGHM